MTKRRELSFLRLVSRSSKHCRRNLRRRKEELVRRRKRRRRWEWICLPSWEVPFQLVYNLDTLTRRPTQGPLEESSRSADWNQKPSGQLTELLRPLFNGPIKAARHRNRHRTRSQVASILASVRIEQSEQVLSRSEFLKAQTLELLLSSLDSRGQPRGHPLENKNC